MRRRRMLALLSGLGLLVAATAAQAAVDKVVFRDLNYPLSWMNGDNADQITTYLTGKGYTMVDAKGLDDFMKKHIADRATSVVVFANDVVPDTVANPTVTAMDGNPRTPDNDLNRYLRTGGKIVYLADWPAYYIGLSDGTKTPGSDTNAAGTLEFYPANWCCNSDDSTRKTDAGDIPMVVFNDAGKAWGLTKPWPTQRGTDVADSLSAVPGTFTVLGNPENNAMVTTPIAIPWVRTFTPDRPGSGFIYLYDRANQPGDFADDDLAQIQKVAEYFPSGEVAISTGIAGTVKTADGKPAVGMRILTTDANGHALDYFTDADGHYFFDLPAGSHTISAVTNDPNMDVQGGTANVTVAQGQVTTQDLTVSTVPIPFFESTTTSPYDDDFSGTTLNSKWTDIDIGDSMGGSAKPNNGKLDVTAGGHDIWDVMDGFHFTFQKVSGDFAATLRVEAIPDNQDWELAGLMARVDMSDNSPHVLNQISPRHQIQNKMRPAKGSASSNIDLDAATTMGNDIMPVWVKIRRVGTRISYSWTEDPVKGPINAGSIRTQPGFAGVTDLLVGIAATSHDASVTDSGFVFSNFKVVPLGGATPPPAGLLGDLNGDGKVDIKDATLSLQIAVGSLTPTDAQKTAGDANKDGKLNIQDTTLILGAAVGVRMLQ